jgi:SAM-dependent methyltransferase
MTTYDDPELIAHLRQEYLGVFDEDMLAAFVRDYVGHDLAEHQVEIVLEHAPGGARVLDIGSGYGSFVLACLGAGLDAVGLEIAPYEVGFARRRLADRRPEVAAESVYVDGNALAMPFPAASFDVVTAWNVLEHVPDLDGVLRETARVLRPGGQMLIVAPNYASFRREAHYQVPWLPLLPRGLATRYLSTLGRDPRFFIDGIHYRTMLGVRRALRRAGFETRVLEPSSVRKLADLERISRPAVRAVVRAGVRVGGASVVAGAARALAGSPLSRSIDLVARRAS